MSALHVLASTLRSYAPAIGDHLWQSTAVFVLVWMLTLLLRSNRAAIRHGLWVVASLKFLLPFSALASAVASLLALLHRAHTDAPVSHVAVAVQAAVQPFVPAITKTSFPQPIAAAETAAWPALLLGAVWAAGALAVLGVWMAHWRAAHWMLRGASLATDGREHTLLRRVEASLGVKRGLPLYLLGGQGEPALFGIVRSVLLWPAALSEHLADEHIDAILRHELMHARRRDNLIAALHMLVQAVFWFHPAVWFVETRSLAERELACDEAVVASGGNRRAYAESLIEASRHAMQAPLAPTAGFTGGGPLSTRVGAVLKPERLALRWSCKALMAAAILVALAVPILIAQTQRKLEFEVASVRQSPDSLPERGNESLNGMEIQGRSFTGGIFSTNAPLYTYLNFAYKIVDVHQAASFMNQMPAWAKDVNFDIEARATQSSSSDDVRLMMQSLLADRFALKLRSETKTEPVLALTLAHGAPGLQLRVHTDRTPCVSRASAMQVAPEIGSARPVYCGLDEWINEGRIHIRYTNATPDAVANMLSSLAHTLDSALPVADHTGLKGLIDLDIEFVKDEQQAEANHVSGPLFDEALSKQLGLKLTRTTVPVTTLVIDHIEPPKPN